MRATANEQCGAEHAIRMFNRREQQRKRMGRSSSDDATETLAVVRQYPGE